MGASNKFWHSAVASLVLTTSATADTVNVQDGLYQAPPGGEFQMTPVTGFAGVTGLAGDVSATTFQTFCVERNEFISGIGAAGGATVSFSIASHAVGGGYGGGSPDPISPQTAYLYTQFRLKTLSNYNYVGDRLSSATALQVAIWILEDEYGGLGGAAPVNAQANAWITEANSAVAGAWGNTIGDVRVLNLVQNSVNAQSMLTIIPLPPAAWAGLVTMAALAGGARARRKRE